jgi:hypothetical protein
MHNILHTIRHIHTDLCTHNFRRSTGVLVPAPTQRLSAEYGTGPDSSGIHERHADSAVMAIVLVSEGEEVWRPL